MPNPVFTAIVDTFNRPHYLRLSVESLLRQTYGDLEIVLVDNASTPESKDYLRSVAAADNRVKLVTFEKNQFSLDDPTMMLYTCLNAGLRASTGDLIWYQSDDDLVSDDYAERMARLFAENADCATAAGLPVAIDAGGRLLESGPRTSNLRPRYMPGRELALRVARGERGLFSAPGTVFTIRRRALVEAGGYHRAIEHSQLYGIAAFGVTGFDEEARLYWRRHEGQLNQLLTNRGWTGSRETFDLLKSWRIRERWEKAFGAGEADEIVAAITESVYAAGGNQFAKSVLWRRPLAALRLLMRLGTHPSFWKHAGRQFKTHLGRKAARMMDGGAPPKTVVRSGLL